MTGNETYSQTETKYTNETAEEISTRMDYLYESNPSLSDNMYPDEKTHYFEFIRTGMSYY